jgi:hypothetical protein
MKHTNLRTVIRSVIAAILVVLGVGALSSGRVVVGVLLLALAAGNVTLTLMMRRRRAELLRRFPNLASRGGRSEARPRA